MEKQIQKRRHDWIQFINEKGLAQESFVFLEHFDASFVKFKLHEGDDTLIILPTARVLKLKDRRIKEEIIKK
jgi:hypothetical protein